MRAFLLVSLAAVCASLHVFDVPGETMIREIETDDGPVQLIVGKKKGRSVNFRVPKSFEVYSKPLSMVSKKKEESTRNGREINVNADANDIPLIDGIRMPDDPSDTQVYRNARIIKNVLVPNGKIIQSDEIRHEPEEEEDVISEISSRQARILTGSDIGIESDNTVDASQITRHSANPEQSPTYYHYYDPSRIGVISQQSLQQINNQENEKVLTYSINTGEAAVENTPSKNVVYGSGFASNPEPSSPQVRSVNRRVHYANALPTTSFQPSSAAAGFRPSKIPYGSSPLQYNRAPTFSDRNIETHSSIKFPETPSSNNNLYNYAPESGKTQEQYYQQGIGSSQYVSPHTAESHRQFAHQPSSYQAQQFYPTEQAPQLHVSQTYQQQASQTYQQQAFNQQSGYPTPQNVLGSSGSIIPESAVIPVDPSNFVIEQATFQSHPGAPIFNIPVPRPSQQSNRKQFQAQQEEYDPYQQYYDYPVYQYIDDRPMLVKMMDPLRRVGDRVRQIASNAGNRLRIPERIDKIASGTVDADAIPIFAGAAAVATLGALGAYAASKFGSFDGLTLPIGGKRSSRFTVPDILSQLADKLNDEDPSIVSKLTADTKWLESSCARKIFCTLVTDSFEEEEQKANSGRSAKLNFAQEMLYLEKQMDALLESTGSNGEKDTNLRKGADEVMNAVRRRDCSTMTCSNKNQ